MAAQTVMLNLIGNDTVSRVLRRVREEIVRTADAADRFGRRAGPAFAAVGRGMGRMLKFAAKFASIGLGAALAISQAVQLVAALAPLVGLLAGLPAAVAVLGAALGTLKLALSGVGEAFKTALGDDPQKFEESLKGLAPAAQAVARELRSLRPTLLGIRNAAQQALFAPLTGQLKATAAVLAGPLKTGVRGVATEYGRAAAGALRFGREGRTAAAVTSIFAGTRRVIAGIAPAITPILRGFRDMAVQGTGTLARLAAGAGTVGARFGEWMQKFAASGGVQRALEGALTVVKALGGLLAGVGGILNSIITAANASGGGLLGVMGQAVAQLNAFLKTAPAQQAMIAFFQTMNQLGAALAPIIPIIGQLAAAVITALMPVVQAITPVISQIVGTLGQTVTALTPAFAPLSQLLVVVAQGIGQIFAAVGPLLPSLGRLISQLVAGLVPVLIPLVQLIAQTASQIGGALVQALIAMMPSLQQLVMSVITLLPVWAQLTPLFAQVLLALVPLVPPLTQIATILITLLVPVLRLAITILVKYWTIITSLIIPVIKLWGVVFSWVANALQVAISAIGAAATWLWQNAILPAWNGIKAAISLAWKIIKPIFNLIVTIVKTNLGIAFKVLQTIVKIVWIAIAAQIKIAWTIIKTVFNALRTVISKTLGPIFRWLLDKVIRPVWNSVSSVISSVYNRGIRPVFDRLKTAVRAVRDAFSTAVSGIKRIWDRLKGIAKTPVNFIIGLYNDGIANLVNKIAQFAGTKTRLGKIPKFATGGVLPGYNPGVDSLLAAVSPGEAIMRPEFARAVGGRFVADANKVARNGGPGGVRRWLAEGGFADTAFARGGIVPGFAGHFDIGGIVGGLVKGLKDFTILDPVKAAMGALKKIVGRSFPGGGMFRDVISAIPNKLVGMLTEWIKKNAGFGGGPGMNRALRWAKTQDNKPYQWAGNGNPSWDCSGFMSAIESVIRGQRPHRRWSTHAFQGGAPAGWQQGRRSGFMIGVKHGGAGGGHTAGTLLNHPVEAGGNGVQVGPPAKNHRNFPTQYGFKFDRGGMLQPGFTLAHNATGRPEQVLTSAQFNDLHAAASGGGGPLVNIEKMIVEEKADVDMVTARLGFAARAAAF